MVHFRLVNRLRGDAKRMLAKNGDRGYDIADTFGYYSVAISLFFLSLSLSGRHVDIYAYIYVDNI